ncbi:sigma-70 family RNA polymerase sigma factor [Planctomicrobium sp. SH664]|uniref:sigma-70 family RNA polymerase sigma factor n=1 Tax=Planctomicrobium sp. SH664 TaxID=3448125 RepID=UPI003F5B47CD
MSQNIPAPSELDDDLGQLRPNSSLQHPDGQDEQFCQLLLKTQAALLGFVVSMVRDPHLAYDIVQETNLVLWRKRSQYSPERSFRRWAFRFGYLQTLAALKAGSQERRILFDQAVIEQIVEDSEVSPSEPDERYARLAACIEKLPLHQREVVQQRYAGSLSLQELADSLGRTVAAVGMTLHRARLALIQCVMAGEGQSNG